MKSIIYIVYFFVYSELGSTALQVLPVFQLSGLLLKNGQEHTGNETFIQRHFSRRLQMVSVFHWSMILWEFFAQPL